MSTASSPDFLADVDLEPERFSARVWEGSVPPSPMPRTAQLSVYLERGEVRGVAEHAHPAVVGWHLAVVAVVVLERGVAEVDVVRLAQRIDGSSALKRQRARRSRPRRAIRAR
jgi:hypothetical protein